MRSEPKVYLRRDPHDTEIAAANRATYRAGTDKQRLLDLICEYGPATTDELSVMMTRFGRPDRPNQYAARILDLVDDGWIADSGLTRATRTGSPAIVWQRTDSGVQEGLFR